MRTGKDMRAGCWLAVMIALTFTGFADAMSVERQDFDQLVASAETVFMGTVTEQRCVWKGAGETRRIMTLVTVQVQETYKGQARATEILELLGGTVDGESMGVSGMPKFSVGGSYVLFVAGNGRHFCPLVGIQQGQFRVERDEETGDARIYTHNGKPVRDTAELGRNQPPGDLSPTSVPAVLRAITTIELRNRILQKMREQAADPNLITQND